MIDIESSCRICLEKGAHHPIFVKEYSEGIICDKIVSCLNEKIEDIEGYPRNICSECINTIDVIYNFKEKYKESCRILEENAPKVKVKVEDENFYSDVETEECLIHFLEINKEPKIEPEEHESSYKNILNSLTEITIKKCTNDIKIKDVKHNISKTRSVKVRKPMKNDGSVKSQKKDCLKISNKERNQQIKDRILKSKNKSKEESEKTPPAPRLCDKCGQTFDKFSQLIKHRKTMHTQEECARPKELYKCDRCPRSYITKYSLKHHIEKYHDMVKKASCDQCGKAFYGLKEVLCHVRVVHENKKGARKTYTCRFCDKTYNHKRGIVCHERSAHTGERPAVCSVCKSAFYDEVYLREHMRLHTGAAPFKCPICNRGYAQRGNMKSHMRNHKISELSPEFLSKLKPSYIKFLRP